MTQEEISAAEVMCSLMSIPSTDSVDSFTGHSASATELGVKKHRRDRLKKSRPNQLIPFALNPAYGFAQVPNSDICHTYPRQIFSALANSDHQAFSELLMSICVPDVELICEYEFEESPFGPNHRHFHGVTNVIDFYMAVMSASPDAVFKYIEPVRVARHKDTHKTFISCKVVMSHTRTKMVVDHINTQLSGGKKSPRSKKQCEDRDNSSSRNTSYSTSSTNSTALSTVFTTTNTTHHEDHNKSFTSNASSSSLKSFNSNENISVDYTVEMAASDDISIEELSAYRKPSAALSMAVNAHTASTGSSGTSINTALSASGALGFQSSQGVGLGGNRTFRTESESSMSVNSFKSPDTSPLLDDRAMPFPAMSGVNVNTANNTENSSSSSGLSWVSALSINTASGQSAHKPSFSARPLQHPETNKYHIGYYIFDVNSDMKITRLCNLFHIASEPPQIKGKVENIM